MPIRRFLQLLPVSMALIFFIGVIMLMLRPAEFGLSAVELAVRTQFPHVQQISPSELNAWIKDLNRSQPLLLDVRAEVEYAVSHLPDAQRVDPRIKNIELSEFIESERPLIAYCSVGYRSSELIDRLRRAGRTNIFNLEGSIFAWANSDYPLVDTSSPTDLVHPYNEFAVRLLLPQYRAKVPPIPLGPMEGLLHGLWQGKMILSVAILFLLLVIETSSPFLTFYKGRPKERFRNDTRNIFLGVLNAITVAALFVGLWFWTARWTEHTGFGLLNWLQVKGLGHALATFILFDLWMYWWHRWNHALPFFWRFHRVHHSDPHMDVTTANRFHFGEIIMSCILRIPVIALLGIQLWAVVLYEIVMYTNVQIHHANITLPSWLEISLRRFIVTPEIHKVHHSILRVETDSNYGAFFTIWDRLFGSFRVRNNLRNIDFGLAELKSPHQLSLRGLLTTPLQTIRNKPRR